MNTRFIAHQIYLNGTAELGKDVEFPRGESLELTAAALKEFNQ